VVAAVCCCRYLPEADGTGRQGGLQFLSVPQTGSISRQRQRAQRQRRPGHIRWALYDALGGLDLERSTYASQEEPGTRDSDESRIDPALQVERSIRWRCNDDGENTARNA
jgi:hypothetical protein